MSDPQPVELRIVSPNISPDEVAAVTAVLQSALEELAAAEDLGESKRVSAWSRSQRSVRGTLVPGPGKWRSFEG